jgi:hypothetical protein
VGTNTFKYHLHNRLCKCGFEVLLDSTALKQAGMSCGVAASAVQAHLLNAGAHLPVRPPWPTPSRRTTSKGPMRIVATGQTLFTSKRGERTSPASSRILKLTLLCTHIYGADRATEWRQRDANFKVRRADSVVVWIARFLHFAREAIHQRCWTRRFISNTLGGAGLHWIAVVVSVETVNNDP